MLVLIPESDGRCPVAMACWLGCQAPTCLLHAARQHSSADACIVRGHGESAIEYQAWAAHASLHEATESLRKHTRLGQSSDVRMIRWIMDSWTRGRFVFILVGPCSYRSLGGLTTYGIWGIAYLGLGLCLGWATGGRASRPSPTAGPATMFMLVRNHL
jgi:hypothetical protein